MDKQHYGYMDKILHAELSECKLHVEPFPEEWKKKYLGGTGIAARIIYDDVSGETDPLDPGNVLCIFTGPYTGTVAPLSGRYGVAAKSPLTGGWGEASVSGFWGPELKFSGFDGIVLRGKSEKPVYLWINDRKAELRPAQDLWGKKTVETEKILKERHGKKTRVLSIGPSGEKLVRFASIISDEGRAGGRCGMGAVMGSKNLKAIAVKGKIKVPTSDTDKLDALAKDYINTIKKSAAYEMMSCGTGAGVNYSEPAGDFPVKNWRLGSFPEAAHLDATGEEYTKILKRKWHCFRCPVGCGRWVKVDREIAGVKPFEGHGPEY